MRTIDEIYAEMAKEYESRCSLVLRPGGDMSLRFYAFAAQVLALENQLEFSRRQAFPQTAQGEYLDLHAGIRGLERGGATKAMGTLRFFVDEAHDSDVEIEAGVICTDAAGTEFAVTEAGAISAGELYCDLPAEAVSGGESGNAPALAICYMPFPPVGVTSCQNPEPFTGGSAGEDDESLRARILDSYSSLPNGANIAYYEAQALAVPGVYAVQVLPKRRGVGTVDVVVAAEGGAPDGDTVSEVELRLQSQREICVDIEVSAPQLSQTNVTVQIESEDFASSKEAAEAALREMFNGAMLGRPVLLAEIGRALFSAEGVTNYHITAPTADIAAQDGVLPTLGTLTITEMGA
jgi:uncharacterized phage protein gp47/JayE